ncbi:MAG: YggS family pyridoxal phosphate-dependent enzyme [Deltaproteobacteria bacterium]|nr:MAG: YggS family pyridoxal phosphate-dependent enzyme [Deltaproteobacteria bacterium]
MSAAKAGRDGTKIKLLAAAKSQSIDALRTAVAAGVTLVGENYVQEAKEKKKQIAAQVEWHMIGHLQRNKAKIAVEIFDMIESLDNVALARELDKEGRRRGKPIRALVEVNLGGQESKSGIDRNGVAALLEEIAELSNLRIEGLMTVPPFQDDPEKVRPYFRDLRELREELNESRYLNVDLQELSMGMTHDYTVAIEEGATIVRIGTALFGPRSL